MTLKEVAAVSGKPGLYRVLKPTRSGVILETIDNERKKLVAGANSRVSILKEISIYTTGSESSVLLENVFQTIYSKYKENIPVSAKSDADELFDFLGSILNNFDRDRVYASDIKKLVSWYQILVENYTELFTSNLETTSTTEEIKEEVVAEEKKAPAKKATKKPVEAAEGEKKTPAKKATKKAE